MFFHGISWAQFEAMLAMRGDAGSVRFTYLAKLELMSPSRHHEGGQPDRSSAAPPSSGAIVGRSSALSEASPGARHSTFKRQPIQPGMIWGSSVPALMTMVPLQPGWAK